MSLNRFRRIYGSHPLHLLTLIAGFALFGYVVAIIKPTALWNPTVWWQSIVVWFAAAIIAHDLVLYPIYTLADRLLVATNRPVANVPALNYIRVPAMGAALTLVIFLPGIVEQGSSTYLAATGQTQDPFLGRWLLLTAAMFGLSAVAFAIRLAISRTTSGSPNERTVGITESAG